MLQIQPTSSVSSLEPHKTAFMLHVDCFSTGWPPLLYTAPIWHRVGCSVSIKYPAFSALLAQSKVQCFFKYSIYNVHLAQTGVQYFCRTPHIQCPAGIQQIALLYHTSAAALQRNFIVNMSSCHTHISFGCHSDLIVFSFPNPSPFIIINEYFYPMVSYLVIKIPFSATWFIISTGHECNKLP